MRKIHTMGHAASHKQRISAGGSGIEGWGGLLGGWVGGEGDQDQGLRVSMFPLTTNTFSFPSCNPQFYPTHDDDERHKRHESHERHERATRQALDTPSYFSTMLNPGVVLRVPATIPCHWLAALISASSRLRVAILLMSSDVHSWTCVMRRRDARVGAKSERVTE